MTELLDDVEYVTEQAVKRAYQMILCCAKDENKSAEDLRELFRNKIMSSIVNYAIHYFKMEFPEASAYDVEEACQMVYHSIDTLELYDDFKEYITQPRTNAEKLADVGMSQSDFV